MTFEFDLVDREGEKEKEMEFTCLLIFRLFPPELFLSFDVFECQ